MELKLRVSGLYRPGEHVYPSGQIALIQLVGSWLERAGFPVGARVRVDGVEDGLLVLSRVDEHAEELSAVATAWEPVEAEEEPSERTTLVGEGATRLADGAGSPPRMERSRPPTRWATPPAGSWTRRAAPGS